MAKKESKKQKEPEHHDEEKPIEASAESHEPPSEPEETPAPAGGSAGKKHPLKKYWEWALTHKKISIPVIVVLFLALLAAIPFTRYALAGLVVKQTFPVVVVDAETGKPVSSATVNFGGQTAETDNEGRAAIRAKVGSQELQVTKNYYESFTKEVLVPIGNPADYTVELKAIGRAVPVTIVNKISKKAVANATIAAEGTEAQTDNDGKAVLVVPADKQEIAVTISGDGFNAISATVTVSTDELPANTFELTPSGKIYFLSNASGKIDVIKSNLDGTDRQTVLAGTGKEDRLNTILIASPDWKYIALLSKRDGGDYPKLFLVEAGSDKVTVMDEGEATFNVYGWSGDRFVYTVHRQKVQTWESKREALKSYHAPTKKITALAETEADGTQGGHVYEDFGNVYILDKTVVYTKNWSWSGNAYFQWQGKQASFYSVGADGSQPKTIKSYGDHYVETRTAEFSEIYILYQENENSDNSKVDEYHDGKIEGINQSAQDYYNATYPYYSVSPTTSKTLWRDYRDGKNVFFVGDNKGENGNEIGRSEDYTTYGWFTDEYVLLTKKGSEMHIMPANGLEGGLEKALKITDYYKPDYQNRGFGYGYGG